MWTTPRPHHDQVNAVELRALHDLLVNLVSGATTTRQGSREISRIDVFKHRRLEQLSSSVICSISAVKQNQFGVVGARERQRVTHRSTGVGRQVSRAKNALYIDHR